MRKSFVLVKNLRSKSKELHFTNFKFVKVGSNLDYDLNKAQNLFTRTAPLYVDWFYERKYETNSLNHEDISLDVENTLFFLRLFKPGDIVFLSLQIELENGQQISQLPYRVLTEIQTSKLYNLESAECANYDEFEKELSSQQNLSSSWFQIARRFFLYGGGKEYNPTRGEADRIVDYMTVLEAILVPESDGFIGRRLRERAVSILQDYDIDNDDIKRLLRDFYNVRSAIVHGSDISSKMDIFKMISDFERIVRFVIIEALKTFPKENKERKAYLKQHYDVSDQDRSDRAFNDFCLIKTEGEKKKLCQRISDRLEIAD
jgi:hypothetical protein